MKTDLRSMLYFFTFVFILTTFCGDIALYGAYTGPVAFPSYTLLSYTKAQSTIYATIGTNFGYPFTFINSFTFGLSYFFAIFYWFASIMYYLIDAIAWFFGLITFPFSYIPSPFNSLMTVMFFAFVGISILTAIRGPTGMGMEA